MACRTERRRGDLLRLVRDPNRAVHVDPAGDMPGRGAYVCRDPACMRLALKRSAFERALRVGLPSDIRGRLERGDEELMMGGRHGA